MLCLFEYRLGSPKHGLPAAQHLDTEAFVTEYDQHLKQFCSRFDASDTSVFHADMKPRLPIGYNRRLEPLPARNPIGHPFLPAMVRAASSAPAPTCCATFYTTWDACRAG